MDIKEIALLIDARLCADGLVATSGSYAIALAETLIESYKAELLKEVGEPVLYAEFAEDGGWLGDASEYADHLEEPHALFTSDQVAAAIAKATEPLEDQLAKVEQRVAEACALQVATEIKFHWLDAARVAKEIRFGEWRKFVKEG